VTLAVGPSPVGHRGTKMAEVYVSYGYYDLCQDRWAKERDVSKEPRVLHIARLVDDLTVLSSLARRVNVCMTIRHIGGLAREQRSAGGEDTTPKGITTRTDRRRP